MNLSDLVSELRNGILNDRTDRVSGTSDYLWTNETLVRYINEAQLRFAVQGYVIYDASTVAVTRVTMATDTDEYDLHDSILAVVSAKLTDENYDLYRAGHSVFNGWRPPNSAWLDPALLAQLSPGTPRAYSTDEEVVNDANGSRGTVKMRVYPTPTSDDNGDTIDLRVVRRPLTTFAVDANDDLVDGDTSYPEIPEEHHLEMLDWAAYLALRIVDDDAGAPKRAEEFRKSFENHVKRARANVMRKMHAPALWGFGRGGFSWSR